MRDTIAIFGVERCMFASNYPVDGLTGDFATILGGFMEMTRDLPPGDRRRLFHDNAVRIYRTVDRGGATQQAQLGMQVVQD